MPTNYASNAVACKLWGLIESPTELVLALALFNHLSSFYRNWTCWVYSETEFRALQQKSSSENGGCVIALVPQTTIADVGRVDFAIFTARLSFESPLLVLECDGHDFHERTPTQASSDRKRDRQLASLNIPCLRFTGTDVVRQSAELAAEVAELLDKQANIKENQ